MTDIEKINELIAGHTIDASKLTSKRLMIHVGEQLVDASLLADALVGAGETLREVMGVSTADATRVPVQEEDEVTGNTSDGYHTFDELYEYRMLYNAHASHGWLAAGVPVVKSWKHSDGELCFGGGWFIVTATLPAGQVSNHYKAEHWGLFKVPEVELPPEYDGHTPKAAADRLRIEAEHTRAVQGEPNDDREVLDNVLIDAREAGDGLSAVRNRILAAGFSRATVPDAASAAIERVRAIHKREVIEVHPGIGEEAWCPACQEHWPCSTTTALDGAPEPEWEEVVQYGNLTSLGFIQETRGRNYAMHKRIVRFGPALPVEGESE